MFKLPPIIFVFCRPALSKMFWPYIPKFEADASTAFPPDRADREKGTPGLGGAAIAYTCSEYEN
jgi:hypothetical protein